MSMKSILALALVATLPTLAFAEDAAKPTTPTTTAPTTTAPTTTAPAATAPKATMPAAAGTSGMLMADAAVAKVVFVTTQPADVLSSRLIGLNVYNNNNESVGEIEDFVIVDGKTISAVVLGVGGFLGLGERYVTVSPSSITLANRDGSLRALVNTDKETLKSAPAFTYSKKK